MPDITDRIDDDKLYEQLGENYRYFLGWRERIFAGYVTVLAGLGFGFANAGRAPFEIGLLISAVLVSVVLTFATTAAEHRDGAVAGLVGVGT